MEFSCPLNFIGGLPESLTQGLLIGTLLIGIVIMSMGDFPDSLSQAVLVGIMLVGRLGVIYIYIYIYIYIHQVCIHKYIYV